MENSENKKKWGLWKKILIIGILVLGSIGGYMRFIEPSFLVVQDYLIKNDKITDYYDGMKIVQFSDVHFGRTTNEKEVEKVVEKINDCEADIVIFSGDLFDSYINLSDANVEFLKSTLSKINAKLKKFAIMGEEDYINEVSFKSIMNQANFELLDGSNKMLYYKGNKPIYLSGVNSIQKGKVDLSKAFFKEEDGLQLFVGHEPDIINEVSGKADVVFTGHSLGGLIRLPFVGGLIRFDKVSKYDKGYYEVNKTSLYVSGGIGTHSLSMRFLNFPEINCYYLVKNN